MYCVNDKYTHALLVRYAWVERINYSFCLAIRRPYIRQFWFPDVAFFKRRRIAFIEYLSNGNNWLKPGAMATILFNYVALNSAKYLTGPI